MKDFSIFEYALNLSAVDQTENLGEVPSITRSDFVERKSFICRSTIAAVEYGCLLIENALLLHTNRGGRVYAGFRKLSSLQPVIDRYLRIADVSEAVFVFAQPDWQLPRHPNIRLIPLKEDLRLGRECFLIVESSTLNIAFVAFDEVPFESDASSEQMRFWLMKTSDLAIVRPLAHAVEGVINWTLAA
ncbi:MAG: DICT sensory domain-containing protein [Pyrinomonadaceae bacterium]